MQRDNLTQRKLPKSLSECCDVRTLLLPWIVSKGEKKELMGISFLVDIGSYFSASPG